MRSLSMLVLLVSAAPRVFSANVVTNGLVASKFCLNVKLCIKPERRAEFVECIRNNQKGTLSTEPLALEYVWGESTDQPNTFHFYEKVPPHSPVSLPPSCAADDPASMRSCACLY